MLKEIKKIAFKGKNNGVRLPRGEERFLFLGIRKLRKVLARDVE